MRGVVGHERPLIVKMSGLTWHEANGFGPRTVSAQATSAESGVSMITNT
jgi:hypothetical protein